MQTALVFDAASNELAVKRVPIPDLKENEALVRVLRAQMCSTDIEITRGYVPGYCQALGHEFVGVVERLGSAAAAAAAEAAPSSVAVGARVVSEINCNDARYACADALFERNHAPGRSVLGIIGRPGCCAEFVAVPARNLHAVPETVSDAEACFAEPLAAALRIVEQGVVDVVGRPARGEEEEDEDDEEAAARRVLAGLCPAGQRRRHGRGGGQPADDGGGDEEKREQRIAVLGDGKLGLLVAQVLSLASPGNVTLFGRHPEKMELVARGGGLAACVAVSAGGDGDDAEGAAAPPPLPLEQQFDVVVEATGSERGIRRALALARPAGSVVLKSTVSGGGGGGWAEVCNAAVVQELALIGSRCGPIDAAVALLEASPAVRRLARDMVAAEFPLSEGLAAMERAKERGVLKVALIVGEAA